MKLALGLQTTARNVRGERSAMRSLTRRDLSCILTSIQQLHACDEPDAFAFEVLAMLLRLVSAKGASFNRLEMQSVGLGPCAKKKGSFGEIF